VKPRRYQLRKEAVGFVMHGHPWLFRDHLSSAASVFRDGDWLRLHDGANKVVGYGIYEAAGAIAIRVLGAAYPDATWLRGRLQAAVDRRRELAARTDGIRLVHGESDGIPAVVADRYGDTIVVTSYAAGADALARYTACALGTAITGDAVGPARSVVLRPARRRHTPPPPARQIRGEPVAIAHFVEDGASYAVELAGQKTGAYLDLRGLRHAIAELPLAGARVLNLFAYTGMLGRAAALAGATDVTNVDESARALEVAAAHHTAGQHHVTADVFAWLPALAANEVFDLVIVDPPAMTSRKIQVPAVLAGYTKLYRAVAPHVRPGGLVVAACCTSRIERSAFTPCVRDALGAGFALERELAPEIDHPVGFPQADYLKIALWRRS
jgi:23S rRNA G2069 N7-methylase RlmK/C1962 C5-methylase RlmI